MGEDSTLRSSAHKQLLPRQSLCSGGSLRRGLNKARGARASILLVGLPALTCPRGGSRRVEAQKRTGGLRIAGGGVGTGGENTGIAAWRGSF